MFVECFDPETQRTIDIPLVRIIYVDRARKLIHYEGAGGRDAVVEMTLLGELQYLRAKGGAARYVDVYSASGNHTSVHVDAIRTLSHDRRMGLYQAEYITASGGVQVGYVSEESEGFGPLATFAVLVGEEDWPAEIPMPARDDAVDEALDRAFEDDGEEAEAI